MHVSGHFMNFLVTCKFPNRSVCHLLLSLVCIKKKNLAVGFIDKDLTFMWLLTYIMQAIWYLVQKQIRFSCSWYYLARYNVIFKCQSPLCFSKCCPDIKYFAFLYSVQYTCVGYTIVYYIMLHFYQEMIIVLRIKLTSVDIFIWCVGDVFLWLSLTVLCMRISYYLLFYFSSYWLSRKYFTDIAAWRKVTFATWKVKGISCFV